MRMKELLEQGWRVTSDGPQGTQLEAPKKIKTREIFTALCGVVLIPFFGLGLLVIVAVVIDYHRRKPETKFIFRS